MVQAHLEAQTSNSGRIPEWPNGADCKSAGSAFGGSNPSAPTGFVNAKIAQLVEHDLAKVGVAGSSPVFRSSSNAANDL